MASKSLMIVGLLVVVVLFCAMFIAWRLRRLTVLRRDAEVRAVAAFEEMNRLTKQLRERSEQDGTTATSPGERLRQRYSGVSASGGGAGTAGSAGSTGAS